MAVATVLTAPVKKYTLRREAGPMIVDYWEPENPSGAAPILLVHGWGGTGSYWRDVAQSLSRWVPVYVPDLPGTGRSQPVTRPQNMFDQVDALVDVIDALEIDRVQIIGHSMGGAMSLLLADARPEPVERIILTSLTFFRTQQQIEVYRNVMRAFKVTMKFKRRWLASVPGMEAMMAKNYFYRVPKGEPMLRQGLLDFLELDGDTAIACADDATDPAIPQAGARVNVPVLLVACRNDNMMPMENVDHTVGIIPDCRVHWMEECGHLPMVEKADEYLSIIHEFLVLGE